MGWAGGIPSLSSLPTYLFPSGSVDILFGDDIMAVILLLHDLDRKFVDVLPVSCPVGRTLAISAGKFIKECVFGLGSVFSSIYPSSKEISVVCHHI